MPLGMPGCMVLIRGQNKPIFPRAIWGSWSQSFENPYKFLWATGWWASLFLTMRSKQTTYLRAIRPLTWKYLKALNNFWGPLTWGPSVFRPLVLTLCIYDCAQAVSYNFFIHSEAYLDFACLPKLQCVSVTFLFQHLLFWYYAISSSSSQVSMLCLSKHSTTSTGILYNTYLINKDVVLVIIWTFHHHNWDKLTRLFSAIYKYKFIFFFADIFVQ